MRRLLILTAHAGLLLGAPPSLEQAQMMNLSVYSVTKHTASHEAPPFFPLAVPIFRAYQYRLLLRHLRGFTDNYIDVQ